ARLCSLFFCPAFFCLVCEPIRLRFAHVMGESEKQPDLAVGLQPFRPALFQGGEYGINPRNQH
ncbi:MAG: hypothetical protein ACREEM_52905, partial [Blastocatellia bacterium]